MEPRVGTFQLQDIQDDIERSLKVIKTCLREADDAGLSIVCFPECFLQGYTLDLQETKQRALALDSLQFKTILQELAHYKTTFILGLIEEADGTFYNTAVVIRQGSVIGTYRKVHLFEKNFTAGDAYPVFETASLKFGINICYDARFSEGAAALKEKGARIIFYPLNNRLPIEKAKAYREKHIPNLIERAQETGCWIVSSDIIASDKTTLGYGCSVIVDPEGNLHTKVPEQTAGMTTVTLPVLY